MRQLDTENADRDLTSLITVLTHTPDASNPCLCQALVLFGDGAKDLDGTGGDFELTITVGGQTIQPDPQTVTFSTAVRGAVFSTKFPVPANAEVVVRVLSPNVADTDVDVTAYLYDVGALQPTTRGTALDVDADGIAGADIQKILATAPTETGAGYLAGSFTKFFDEQTPTGTINSLPDATPGEAGGLTIAGSNAATTFATLTVSGETTMGGVSITNASGVGLAITGSTTGMGIHGATIGLDVDASGGVGIDVDGTTSGATITGSSAIGLRILSTNEAGLSCESTNSVGLVVDGGTSGATFTAGNGSGIIATGYDTGHGMQLVGGASGKGLSTASAAVGVVTGTSVTLSGTLQAATVVITGALSVGGTTTLAGNVGLGAGLAVTGNTALSTLSVSGIITATAANDIRGVKVGGFLDSAITEGEAGRIAAAVTKFGNVATPTLTAESVNQTGDNYSYLGTNLGLLGASATALATSVELAKVPKSDSNVTWNATALASINAEVDAALNTAIPGAPIANSINERVATMDGLILGTLAAGTHTAQSGDAYAYLGTNLGLLGVNATEAGGTGDHLTAVAQASTALSSVVWTNTKAGYLDAAISGVSGLDAAGVRTALGMTSNDMDDQLDAILSQATAAAGASAGTGARTVVLTVDDGGSALESVRVRVTKGGESYVQSTDASGEVTFNLDDGTWTVALSLANYTYSGTTLVVDDDETATLSMTESTFTPSTAPDTITIRATCYGSDRLAVGAGETVLLRIKSVPDDTEGIWDKGNQTETTDANGVIEFTDIIAGSELLLTCGDNTEVQSYTVPTDATSPHDIGPLYGVFD